VPAARVVTHSCARLGGLGGGRREADLYSAGAWLGATLWLPTGARLPRAAGWEGGVVNERNLGAQMRAGEGGGGREREMFDFSSNL
jgi:hypothetical protein